MMAALLQSLLCDRLGPDAVEIRSSGFGPAGMPPIGDAVEAMRRRGLDISEHRSASTTAALVDAADLILTAERAHVVKVAALSPAAFARTMTLPEFLAATAASPVDTSLDLRAAVVALTRQRTASGYLREPVAEIADPTGSPPRAFEAAVVVIEQQCRDAATWLAARSRR